MSERILKKGEFGKTLYFNSGVNISTGDSFLIEFTKPQSGELITKTGILETVDRVGLDENGAEVTFLANEYTSYVIEAGLLDECGAWCYRTVNSIIGAFSVPGDTGTFQVD